MRYPKANLEKIERGVAPIELGQAEILEWGTDAMLVAYGTLFPTCVKAAGKAARARACDVGVINARFCQAARPGHVAARPWKRCRWW